MWFNKSQFHSFPDEPIVPTMSKGRRGTVFAEAYNPEEDDEDDVKVNPLNLILNEIWFKKSSIKKLKVIPEFFEWVI